MRNLIIKFNGICLGLILILASIYLESCRKNNTHSPNSLKAVSNKNKVLAEGGGSSTNTMEPQWQPVNWMRNLSSDFSMSQISMPGTHESAALYGWMTLGKCQDLSIKEQLEIGVRYLDIRCKLIKEKALLTLYHGMIDQKMTFDEVLAICNSFLQKNPSETIVMKLKEENGPKAGSPNFAEIVAQHFDKYDPDLFYRQRDPDLVIPKLKDTRGKILVLKKFEDPMHYVPVGITVKGGEDNFTETINLSSEEKMVVQNTYKIWNNEQKAQLFKATLEESFSNPNQTSTWYINPTSGFHPATSSIGSIAAYMGSLVVKTLKAKGKGNAGTIPMDFIKADYCKAIIETNHFTEVP